MRLFIATISVTGASDQGCGDSNGSMSSDQIRNMFEKQIQQECLKLTCRM